MAASMLGQSSRKRSFGIWGTCSNRWGKCVPSHQLSKWPAIAQWRYMWNWYQKNVTAPKSCQQWLFATCGTGTEKCYSTQIFSAMAVRHMLGNHGLKFVCQHHLPDIISADCFSIHPSAIRGAGRRVNPT